MEFTTLDEALNNTVHCDICGRPKKELQSVHLYCSPSVYMLVRCKRRFCAVHCSKATGCSHVRKLV